MHSLNPSPAEHLVVWPGVKLCLDYRLDRWGHALTIGERGAETTWLLSCEGTPDDSQPPSPAFQDLRWEALQPAAGADAQPGQLDAGEFQLFGQCGKQTYSAAIRCTPGQIEFDLCVRFPVGEAVSPGSTYLSFVPMESLGVAATAASNPQLFEAGLLIGGRLRLEPLTLGGDRSAIGVLDTVEPNPRVVVSAISPGVQIRKSKTVRWGYRLSW